MLAVSSDPLPTTYIGTSVAVVPAPAALAAFGVTGTLHAGGRRRRK